MRNSSPDIPVRELKKYLFPDKNVRATYQPNLQRRAVCGAVHICSRERCVDSERKSMRVIGIVGGIASGKSAVARRLAHWGAKLLSADQLGHDVLCEPEVRQAIGERWG